MKRRIIYFLLLVTAAVLICTSCSGELPEYQPIDGWQEYTIIRPDAADPTTIDAAMLLRDTIEARFGVRLKVSTDWVGRGASIPEGTCEILVGDTNRPESETLQQRDYMIKTAGTRLVIGGGSGEAVMAAVEWFLENCVSETLSAPTEAYVCEYEYPLETVSIGGIPLSDFGVADDGGGCIDELRQWLTDGTGYIPAKDGEHQIRFGVSDKLAMDELSITMSGSDILLETSDIGYDRADVLAAFIAAVEQRDGDDIILNERITKPMEFLNECTTDQITEWRAEADSLRAEIRATPNMEIPDDAVVYYISESGDDENDGRSPETAWKTIDRMSREALPYGSYVCFERGGVYRGKLDASAGVTYTAYGEGDKPRIYGSPFNGAEHGEWMEVADNIWRYSEKFTGDVGGIVMNGGEAHGIKRLVVYRETGMTDTITGESFTGYQDLRGELDFYHDLGGQVNENSDGGYLYLRCEAGNPGELWDSIEFLTYWHIINCGTNPDITIDNLCVMYGGSHGISTGDIQNLTVTNCEIGWIGGSIQFYRSNSPTRYGNGIEVYGSCDGYIIDHCYVYECYDAGITHQIARGNRNVTHQNVRYTNNLIERCVYNIEYFLGYSTSPSTVRWMADILISGNILANAGYGWGRQRPDKYNPASIKSWDMMNTLAGEFLIEDNLILFSDNMMLHIGAETSDDLPTFRNNTLVQYVGGKLGWYMQNPTEQLLYTDESIDKFGIGDNEFYVARND